MPIITIYQGASGEGQELAESVAADKEVATVKRGCEPANKRPLLCCTGSFFWRPKVTANFNIDGNWPF